jgi:hypothetical protein
MHIKKADQLQRRTLNIKVSEIYEKSLYKGKPFTYRD